MKKIRKYLWMLIVVGVIGGAPIMAKAAFHDFTFFFDDLETQKNSTAYNKSDNDQYWYMTINRVNTTMSQYNIFGCKMHRSSNDVVDVYHTFSNYVTEFPIKYKAQVYKNDLMHMTAKKDSASTSSNRLTIYGKFAP